MQISHFITSFYSNVRLYPRFFIFPYVFVQNSFWSPTFF